MCSNKYRRDGTPYPDGDEGLFEWAKDIESREKQIVRQETLPNGYFVSTVWLGLNHQWSEGPPLIFETMVFLPNSHSDDYCERYSTEDEALAGHVRAVEEYLHKAPI